MVRALTRAAKNGTKYCARTCQTVSSMVLEEGLHEILTRQFCELLAYERDEEEYEEDAELVRKFFTLLNEPVHPKKAKYAKAVSRILGGEQATLFFAVEYRDTESLKSSDTFAECLPDFLSTDDESRRARSWQTLRAMVRLCYVVECVEPPVVPTRADIEANISQFRAMKQRAKNGPAIGGSGSMQRAFFEKLLETASVLPGPLATACRQRLHAIPTQDHAAMCIKWAEHQYTSRSELFGDDIFTADEHEAFAELDAAKWQAAEAQFRQLNDLSKVQQNIPSSMLGTIENYATNLASKITAGDADLSSLDLQSIGEDVLRQCSEEDMSQLANNIGSLLPALGSLQQTVQSQAGAHGQGIPNLGALGLAGLLPPAPSV